MIVLNAETPSAGLHQSSSTTSAGASPMPPQVDFVHRHSAPVRAGIPMRRISAQWQHRTDADLVAVGST
jgi:hypothetical protein